jgi:hypothetical protein
MTKQPARIQVKETEEYYGDFEGSLESIISQLQSELDAGWEGIEMGGDQWSEVPYLYKHREETDKEYEKRMKLLEKEKTDKLKAKERRRKEYEKLKKEFEDTP